MHIRQILQRREQIREELRALVEKHSDGNLPPEAVQRSTELEQEAERLNAAEKRQLVLDEMDRRATATPLTGDGGSGDARFDQLCSRVSAVDVIRTQLGDTSTAAGRAKEVSAELAKRSGRSPAGLYWPWRQVEKRNLGLSTGGGSNLIQTDVSPATIDILRSKSIVMQAGATVMAGLTGNLAIPRLTASASVGWVADGTGLTPSNPNFDQLVFSPKHAGGIVGISRQILQQSSPDIEMLIESDVAAINGSGPPQPTGILKTAGLPIVPGGTDGAAATFANLQALIGSVDTSNALAGRLAFLTNSKVAKSLRTTLKSTADTSSNFILTVPDQLLGYPLFVSQNVPGNLSHGAGTNLSAIIFGDISAVYIAAWSMLDILANPLDSTAYAQGAILVRAMCTIDLGIRHVAALAAITDVIAP